MIYDSILNKNDIGKSIPKELIDIHNSFQLILHKPLFNFFGSWLKYTVSARLIENELGVFLLSILKEERYSETSSEGRVEKIKSIIELLPEYKNINFTIEKLNSLEQKNWINLNLYVEKFHQKVEKNSSKIEFIAGVESFFRSIGKLPIVKEFESQLGVTVEAFDYSKTLYPNGIEGINSKIKDIVGNSIFSYSVFLDGLRSAESFLKKYIELTQKLAMNAINSHFRMINLVFRKTESAKHYHHDVKLCHFSLDDLFSHEHKVVKENLDLLYRSKLINIDKPESSYLIKINNNVNSKMFRIFTSEDIKDIIDWVKYYNFFDLEDIYEFPSELLSQSESPNEKNIRPTIHNVRDAYFEFVNLQFPFNEFAKLKAHHYTSIWLKASRSSSLTPNKLPNKYEGLNSLLTWAHKVHSESFVKSAKISDSPPSKEAMVMSTIRSSPLVLLDGVWLLGTFISRYVTTCSELMVIADDEFGNGDIRLNHPKIYRKVLQKMGVELPAVFEKEFCNSSLFQDEDFLRPLFWLSIMLASDEFFPEMLGLNLAIELAGVGASYKTTSENLKKHGFPTIFTDLHNSIDNIESGHSYLAIKAIDKYLKECDISDLTTQYSRVINGYNSLFLKPNFFIKRKLIRSLRE